MTDPEPPPIVVGAHIAPLDARLGGIARPAVAPKRRRDVP